MSFFGMSGLGRSFLNRLLLTALLGPNSDLTIEGDGIFAFGEAVPETSTLGHGAPWLCWLRYAGYRRARVAQAA
jgi:hypothetical protein